MSEINLGIIGYGYWGPNLVRNFNSLNTCRVQIIGDKREIRIKEIKKSYPYIETTNDEKVILTSKQVDAVVIATPVNTHFDLAKQALENGKHVLLEKPMTDKVKNAEILINLALKKNLLLMVDHTFLYTGAVQKIYDLIKKNELGNLNYIDSTRINLGLFQADINVLWDLAPHDISIVNFISNEIPESVIAIGKSHTDNNIENIAYLTLNYQSNLITHISSSWSSPVKVRKMLIGGDKKMIVYDDVEPTEKIKIYNSGYSVNTDEDKKNILVDYRVGDIYVPKVSTKEALSWVAEDFISSVLNATSPISNYETGINVVKVLSAAENSIKNNGKEIYLQAL